MSTIALTPEQATAKTAFAAFVAAGVQTQVGGFKLDTTTPLTYTIDATGTKLRANGALANVDMSKLNPFLRPAAGAVATPVIPLLAMSWDMNGVADGNRALSLVQVVS